MARTTERRSPRRSTIAAAVASIAVVGTVAGFAIASTGYQSQEVPRLEPSVWVTRDDGRYARVNTDLAELDTVRTVDEPSGVAQTGSQTVVFSGGLRERWTVDPAAPVDLVDAAADAAAGEAVAADASGSTGSEPTPEGTRDIATAGGYVLYRSESGQISLGTLDDAEVSVIDPYAAAAAESGEEAEVVYAATAAAVDADGHVVSYSAAEGAVRRYDAKTGGFTGQAAELQDAPETSARVELAIVGNRWILLEPGADRVWIEGRERPYDVDLQADALVQESSRSGDTALVADGRGLVEIGLSSGSSRRVVAADGVPAAPVVVQGDAYAAWLGEIDGVLWSRTGGEVALTPPDDVFSQADSITPVFRTNGDRAVLNETGTGLVWTAPDARLVPIAQWAVDDEDDEQNGTIIVDDVAEQKPPTAVADAFGVRAGQLVTLPVLLNDHDPNRSDVLTIAAGSVTPLSDPEFGDVSVVTSSQSLAVRVAAGAGSATFQYAVSDGKGQSQPATVTLTVVPDGQNSAPVWCGVDECRQVWPTPTVLPGGTAIVPVLDAWVDPDGDSFVLSDAHAAEPGAPVAVVPRADGRIAVRHSDPNADDARIPIVVTVADANGAVTEKTLEVVVSASSAIDAAGVAVTAGAGETVVVDVADHVSGGSGAFRLADAVDPLAGASGLTVTPNAAAGEVELSAPEPGEYVVTYTVVDTLSQAEKSATIRLTVVDRAAPLAIAPLTAFVRPGEDTTVDVLHAVQNPTGRVLLLGEATSASSELSVGIVGAAQLRVAIASGQAPADGRALVGRVRVSVTDGNGATVVGVVDVFLASDAGDESPIALPDTATARAGTLTDIPVLANDVSPRGARLVVGHEIVGSGTDGELAFASGDTLRYLAPTTPGVYRVTYGVALESDPSRTDHAIVTVTVLPAGANRPPRPTALSARVLSGQTIEIPVPVHGVDPDGDRVVLSGVAQPKAGSGTASIGAEGDTVLYRAPAQGVAGGQVAFEYTVRDAEGETATAPIRIGVLNAELADAAPVTFSDYVRVTRGSETPLTLAPLANDRDPALGALELVDLVPNAPAGTPEYERLDALIDAGTSLRDGRVALRAGEVSGTNSFVYTARSSTTSSTAQGLIVVSVAEEAGVDHPVVSDTVVTARNRSEFEAKGLDVVTGRVEWATGDIGSLEVELWGPAASRYRVDGWRVSGKLPAQGEVVPFRVSTADDRVSAYGILRIPAFDDLPIQLRADVDPVVVGEEKTKSFDVGDLLDLSANDRVQIGDGPFTVQRPNSSCAKSGAGGAAYQAGREAPWTDTCLVPVRLQGQQRWSSIAVPVDIEPKDPQAQLAAISRTVAPAATETVALYDDLTTWEGGRVGDRSKLDYRVGFSGSSFLMTQSGDRVTFEARADAIPGTRETATVSVTSFGGISATITLVVGVAPPDAPRGAVFTSECRVTSGDCTIPVVGVSGEYDPFAGKTGSGLQLVSVGTGGAGVRCDVATVSANGATAITARFPGGQEAFGGTCVVPYTVKDAQGRTGSGTVTIDVLGYPQRPASISTYGYTGDSVTLEVSLGDAAKSHPPVTGVVIARDGRPQSADCALALTGVYRCTVAGLENGVKTQFTARAVNQIGESTETSAVTSWAYRAPEIVSATAKPIYDRARTTRDNAVVEITVVTSGDTDRIRIPELGGRTESSRGGQTTFTADVRPGPQNLTVVPVSRFEPPLSGSVDGASKIIPVQAAGTVRYTSGITAKATSASTVEVSGGQVDANGSTLPIETKYLAWTGSREPECRVSSSGGGLEVSGAEVESSTPTIGGLENYTVYSVKSCSTNGYGADSSGVVQVLVKVADAKPSGSSSYKVKTSPQRSSSGSVYSYVLEKAPGLPAGLPKGYTKVQFLWDGAGDWQSRIDFSTGWAPANLQVRGCTDRIWFNDCSEASAVTVETAPTIVDVTFQSRQCFEPSELGGIYSISQAAAGSAKVTPTNDGVTATYLIEWTGDYAKLEPITHTVAVCQPEPEPEPTPDPPTTQPTEPGDPTAPPTP